MALQKVQFLPGFNKQVTPTQAEGQWVDGDNVQILNTRKNRWLVTIR